MKGGKTLREARDAGIALSASMRPAREGRENADYRTLPAILRRLSLQ